MTTKILFLLITLFTATTYASDDFKDCTQSELDKTTEIMGVISAVTDSYMNGGQPSLSENRALQEKCDSYVAGWTRNAQNRLVSCQTQITYANGETQVLLLPRPEIASACERVERVLAVCSQEQNCL